MSRLVEFDEFEDRIYGESFVIRNMDVGQNDDAARNYLNSAKSGIRLSSTNHPSLMINLSPI